MRIPSAMFATGQCLRYRVLCPDRPINLGTLSQVESSRVFGKGNRPSSFVNMPMIGHNLVSVSISM
eukprot:7506632-Heterocapsa_arctica.AAC.1